ncbi:MAG: ABC transporter permease [Dehalococcoidia bacterium]|nr:MAG: ABC transporter permease [Dehalococcoidia bacterium]
MIRIRSLAVLAVRRISAHWRLFASAALGAVVSSAILSSTVIYADTIRDLGLRHALERPPAETLAVKVTREASSARRDEYQRSAQRIERTVRDALGDATGDALRQGTSQTFYLTPAGARVDDGDPARPRAVLRFRDALDQHIVATAGTLPPAGAATGQPLPVAVAAGFAAQNHVAVGDRLDLHAWWDPARPPLSVQVVATVRANDPAEAYWKTSPTTLDEPASGWPAFVLLVPEEAFFGTLTSRMPTASATYYEVYGIRREGLNARNAASVANGVQSLPFALASVDRDASVRTDLEEVLRSFDDRLFFVRIPLFVLLLQIGGIVAYYLVMVSTMLVERYAPEMAVLRSRGASPLQLLIEFGVEGLILAAGASTAGPLLAAGLISALGPTPPFAALSDGAPLAVHISFLSYAFSAGGALLAFAAFMLPAWRATRTTVVEFRRASARPRPTPLLLRYYLDVALVLLLGVVFWRLRQDEQLFTRTLFGERQSDPLLLATPAVIMVTVGVVFLRLFPLVLRTVAWGLSRIVGAAALVGVRSLARDPTHYSRLVLMLMLATGVGMFGATFSATLDHSYDDRSRYPVGADVRAADMRGLAGQGDVAFTRAMQAVPAKAMSAVVRVQGVARFEGKSETLQVLGVDPATFPEVAFFRDDFADDSLPTILSSLAGNAATPRPVPLPPDARQFGLWAKFADIRGPISLAIAVRDAEGRRETLPLGTVRPADEAAREWRFFAVNLETRRGAADARPPLTPPLTFDSVFTSTVSGLAAQRGVVLFGPLLATSAPASGGPVEGPATAPFADARIALDFSAPGFEVVQGQHVARVTDTLTTATDAPPGASAVARYEWSDTRVAPRDRGIRPVTDGEPVLVHLAKASAERLGVQPGGTVRLLVGGVYTEARVAGTFDLFPTYDASGKAGFAVVEASRLTAAVNSSITTQPVVPNEAWFATDDAARTRDALAAYVPQVLLDARAERARQTDDPLIAAGWAGILGISFATVLTLSAIAFVLYSYLTAQRRALEFAILRTLGFSRVQVFLVVAIEYLAIVVAGMGLGTVVGLQVGRRMMDVLGISEGGTAVLPPFALAVSWFQVFTVWGVLGATFVLTIGAVVLLYVRLAIHRALRVGEG